MYSDLYHNFVYMYNLLWGAQLLICLYCTVYREDEVGRSQDVHVIISWAQKQLSGMDAAGNSSINGYLNFMLYVLSYSSIKPVAWLASSLWSKSTVYVQHHHTQHTLYVPNPLIILHLTLCTVLLYCPQVIMLSGLPRLVQLFHTRSTPRFCRE